jgi:peptide/nickel transport system permease protein
MTATGKLNPLAILLENRLARLGMGIIGIFIVAALFAPWLAPHDPIAQNLGHRLYPPCWTYPLGTDDLGRCVLSRLIHATRISLKIGILVVGITAIGGSMIGLLSGYTGGITDELIMRVTDVFLAFPGIVLALVVAGVLGPGLTNAMLALALIGWTGYARLVRGCVLSAREKTFVEATQALGAGHAYIMFRHILPEVLGPVLVMATLGMGWTILSAAALSFLGLGAQPPVPEWGAMLSSGRPYLRTAWHLSTFPGLAIMMVVLAFNFLGDGLNDALNHRGKIGQR